MLFFNYSCVFGYQGNLHRLHCSQVGFNEAFASTGALVHFKTSPNPTCRRGKKPHAYIIKIYILYLTWHIATYETGIITKSSDIVKVDTAYLAATPLYLSLGESPVGILMIAVGTWIAGNVDRLGQIGRAHV